MTDYDMPATAEQAEPQTDPAYDEGPADPYAIEALLLPSGAKVTFRSMARMTGEDVRWIRGVDDKQGAMVMYNEINRRGMVKLIESWDLASVSGRPLAIPSDDPKSTWLKLISAFDLGAIERHLRDPLKQLLGDDIGSNEGE